MQIDWTLNLTGVLGIITFTIGGLWFAAGVQKDVKDLQEGAKAVDNRLAILADAMTSIARGDERIRALGRRLDDERAEGAEWRQWVRGEFAKLAADLGQAWAALNKKADK